MSIEHRSLERAANYAAILREQFETKGMLAQLQSYPNFVVWRYHVVDGQRKKPPFNPNTQQSASPTEPRSWGTLETALTAIATGRYQGIGFMLSIGVKLRKGQERLKVGEKRGDKESLVVRR